MSHSGFGGGRRGQYPLRQPVFPELPPSEDPMPAYDLESVGDPSITADTDSVADLFGKGKTGQKMKKKG